MDAKEAGSPDGAVAPRARVQMDSLVLRTEGGAGAPQGVGPTPVVGIPFAAAKIATKRVARLDLPYCI
jgi:hypothetical protein